MERGLFDPLAYLAANGASVRLVGGQPRLVMAPHTRPPTRRRLLAVARAYRALILLQCDVPAGDRPRTVRQLLATGRLLVRAGRYRAATLGLVGLTTLVQFISF